MSTWSEAATQIKAWQAANPGKVKSLLVKAGDIGAINSQLSSGMQAFRLYLGLDSNGNITGTLVGCTQDANGNYNDYNIPVSGTDFINNASTLPTKRATDPCPTVCGGANYLNS